MSTTIDINDVELEEFQSRVFADLAAGYGGVMISLGAKLGLYAALAGAAPLTSADVASERAAPSVTSANGSATRPRALPRLRPRAKTYTLPRRAAVLADPQSPAHLTPTDVVASMWLDEPWRSRPPHRQGVPWGAHHERLFNGVAAFFRTGYRRCSFPSGSPRWTAW
jgi:hypothetical protein